MLILLLPDSFPMSMDMCAVHEAWTFVKDVSDSQECFQEVPPRPDVPSCWGYELFKAEGEEEIAPPRIAVKALSRASASSSSSLKWNALPRYAQGTKRARGKKWILATCELSRFCCNSEKFKVSPKKDGECNRIVAPLLAMTFTKTDVHGE